MTDTTATIEDPELRLLFSEPDGRRALGNIGHTKYWELISRGDLELVKIGRRSFVTGESLRRVAKEGAA